MIKKLNSEANSSCKHTLYCHVTETLWWQLWCVQSGCSMCLKMNTLREGLQYVLGLWNKPDWSVASAYIAAFYTNRVQHSPSWDANIPSESHKIPHILWYLSVHHHDHNSLQTFPTLFHSTHCKWCRSHSLK